MIKIYERTGYELLLECGCYYWWHRRKRSIFPMSKWWAGGQYHASMSTLVGEVSNLNELEAYLTMLEILDE